MACLQAAALGLWFCATPLFTQVQARTAVAAPLASPALRAATAESGRTAAMAARAPRPETQAQEASRAAAVQVELEAQEDIRPRAELAQTVPLILARGALGER